ncbi:MAG: hypothetical protein KJO13_06105, partial [Gammaproteobacteria bacterium]|nr:hypothetical protein [Gammaproteobacteria bacterium]
NYFDNALTDATSEVYTLIGRALPEIGDRILGQRFGLMWEMIIHSLADRERHRLQAAGAAERESERFINNLIDVVTGGLTTPVSAETSRAR